MYLIESSSPFVPGERPSNSSDERILMCASKASGVMTSSAGFSFSSGLSAAKTQRVIPSRTTQERRNAFIDEVVRDVSTSPEMTRLLWRELSCMRQPLNFILSPLARGEGRVRNLFSSSRWLAATLSAFLRRAGGRFLFVFAFHADLFQERFDRLFPAKKFFDRHRNVASIALGINFLAQLHSGLLVEITVLRFFKNGCHIGGDRVGPGVTVVTGIVPIHAAEIGDEGRARVDREKNFFENRIGNRDAIVGRVHLLDDVTGNFPRRIAIISGERIEYFFVPDPVL